MLPCPEPKTPPCTRTAVPACLLPPFLHHLDFLGFNRASCPTFQPPETLKQPRLLAVPQASAEAGPAWQPPVAFGTSITTNQELKARDSLGGVQEAATLPASTGNENTGGGAGSETERPQR